MRVTITDEETRWLLKSVAWIQALEAIGDGIGYSSVCDTEAEHAEMRERAAGVIAHFHEFEAITRQIEDTPLGATVTIDPRLMEELRDAANTAVIAAHGNPQGYIPEALERLVWVAPAAARVAAAFRAAEEAA